MNNLLNPDEDQLSPAEKEFEKALRPSAFADFMGQGQVVDNLRIFVQAAKMRGEALDHVLLHGPPGLGENNIILYHCQ
jgi:holliday junction DNA helicase RuvB